MVSCISVTCMIGGALSFETCGPKRGSIQWAEAQIKLLGIVKRKTKLKRLSAKKIASIVERMVDAEEWRENHECEPYYRDDYL